MKSLNTILNIFAVVACGVVLFFSGLFSTGWYVVDFCQNYLAAQRFFAGKNIYDAITCIKVPMYATTVLPAHPPFSVFIYLPFANLDFNTASYFWLYLSLIFYFAGVLVLLKALKIFSPVTILIFTVFSIFWRPFIYSNSVHNMMQLLFLLIAVSFYFYKKGKFEITGVFLGIAALLKVWPACFVLVALLTKNYKILRSSLYTYLFGTFLAVLFLGINTYVTYVLKVIPNERFFYPDPSNMSIAGFVTRLFTGFKFFNLPPVIHGFSLTFGSNVGNFLSAVVFIITVIKLKFLSEKGKHKFDDFIIFGITPILIQLTFPLSWDWAGIIFLLPLSILITYLIKFHKISRVWFFFLGISSLSIFNPHWQLLLILFKLPKNGSFVNTLLAGWFTPFLFIFLLTLIYYLKRLTFPQKN